MKARWKPQTKKPITSKPVGAEAPGTRQRLHESEVGLAGGVFGAAAQREGERDDQHQEHREIHQRILPAEGGDEALADGREGELAEGRGGRGDAEDQRALFGRHIAAEGDHDDREGRGGDADAAENAGCEIEQEGIGRHHHQHEASGVDQQPEDDDAGGAVLVCNGAGEGLGDAPDEVLDRHGHAPGLAGNPELAGERQSEQAETGADAVGDGRDQAAGDDERQQRHGDGTGRGGGGDAHWV